MTSGMRAFACGILGTHAGMRVRSMADCMYLCKSSNIPACVRMLCQLHIWFFVLLPSVLCPAIGVTRRPRSRCSGTNDQQDHAASNNLFRHPARKKTKCAAETAPRYRGDYDSSRLQTIVMVRCSAVFLRTPFGRSISLVCTCNIHSMQKKLII